MTVKMNSFHEVAVPSLGQKRSVYANLDLMQISNLIIHRSWLDS